MIEQDENHSQLETLDKETIKSMIEEDLADMALRALGHYDPKTPRDLKEAYLNDLMLGIELGCLRGLRHLNRKFGKATRELMGITVVNYLKDHAGRGGFATIVDVKGRVRIAPYDIWLELLANERMQKTDLTSRFTAGDPI
jgi:hypothetical protein